MEIMHFASGTVLKIIRKGKATQNTLEKLELKD